MRLGKRMNLNIICGDAIVSNICTLCKILLDPVRDSTLAGSSLAVEISGFIRPFALNNRRNQATKTS